MIPTRLCLRDRQIFLRLSQRSDYEGVLQFLRHHFYPFDRSSHGRVSGRHVPEDEEHEMKCIDSGTSVLAFADTELIGVSLGRRYREDESRKYLQRLKKLSSIRGYPNDLEGVIFAEEMKLKAQICRRFNTQEVFFMSLTAVREDFQRISLGRTIMEKSLNCAAEKGFKAALSFSVTNKGLKATESFNFQPIFSIRFVDYQDYRGLSVYNTFPPEAVAVVACKTL